MYTVNTKGYSHYHKISFFVFQLNDTNRGLWTLNLAKKNKHKNVWLVFTVLQLCENHGRRNIKELLNLEFTANAGKTELCTLMLRQYYMRIMFVYYYTMYTLWSRATRTSWYRKNYAKQIRSGFTEPTIVFMVNQGVAPQLGDRYKIFESNQVIYKQNSTGETYRGNFGCYHRPAEEPKVLRRSFFLEWRKALKDGVRLLREWPKAFCPVQNIKIFHYIFCLIMIRCS